MKSVIFLLAALSAAPACETSSAGPANAQVVAVTADGSGFTPSRITLERGRAAVLRFTRTSDATCAKKVVFPAIHVEKDLPLDVAVDVAVPTDSAREIAFQCGMGMYKSAVLIR